MTKNISMLMTKLWNQAHKENKRRNRASKCYVAPKPYSKEEKSARAEKALKRREEIKIYNSKKTTVDNSEAIAERTKFNVAESLLRDIESMKRRVLAVMGSTVKTPDKKVVVTTRRFYKVKRVEALKLAKSLVA